MAIAFVDEKNASGTSTSSGTLNGPALTFASIPQGALIAIWVAWASATITVTAPTESNGGSPNNAWSSITLGSNSVRGQWFYRIAGASETLTKTFTTSANVAWSAIGVVFTGIDQASPLDFGDTPSSFSSTHPFAATSSTVNNGGADRAGRLVLGAAAINSAAGSYTLPTDVEAAYSQNGGSGVGGCLGWARCAPVSGKTYSMSFDFNANRNGVSGHIAFKGDAALSMYWQPVGSDAVDAYLDSANTSTNNGSATTLKIGDGAGKGTNSFRSLCRFDLSAHLPDNCQIGSCALRLHITAITGTWTPGADVNRLETEILASAWIEAQATWNNYKTSTAWPTSPGAGLDTDATIWMGLAGFTPAVGWMDTGDCGNSVRDAVQLRAAVVDLLLWSDAGASNSTATMDSGNIGGNAFGAPMLRVDLVGTAVRGNRRMLGVGL